MIDCPCGFGKNIKEDQVSCPICGSDLTPLHRLSALPGAFLERGLGLKRKGRLREAKEVLSAAAALNSDGIEAQLALAELYLSEKCYYMANVHCKRAIEIDPNAEGIALLKEKIELAIPKEHVSDPEPLADVPKKRPCRTMFLILLPVFGFILGLLLAPRSAVHVLQLEKDSGRLRVKGGVSMSAASLKQYLVKHESLRSLSIDVESRNGGLALNGKVPSVFHRDVIGEIARDAAKGVSVDTTDLVVDVSAEQPKKDFFLYKVQVGDTLASIAKKFYGDALKWQIIVTANTGQMGRDHMISVGQHLSIPLVGK